MDVRGCYRGQSALFVVADGSMDGWINWRWSDRFKAGKKIKERSSGEVSCRLKSWAQKKELRRSLNWKAV
jgi:hypothetical protein